MNRKKHCIILLLMWATALSVQGQEVWNLERCITYAYDNNIQIKQQRLNAAYQKNVLKQSKADVLPSLNAGANYNLTYGRAVDPFTNEFSETNVKTTNLSINGALTLFNGLKTYHTVQRNNLNLMSSLQEVEKMKNDISLNIATAYLQILYSYELLEIAKSQLEITRLQVERTSKLVEAGSLAKGNLLEIQAQAATEELQVINAENDLKSNYLTLIQLLDLKVENSDEFVIERPAFDDFEDDKIVLTPQMIYLEAQELPQVKSAKLNVQSAEQNLAIVKGSRYPSLSLNVSYGTGYSDARKKYAMEIDPENPVREIGYVGDDPSQVVYSPNLMQTEYNYAFGDQFVDNASTYISFRLNIPIFNNWNIENNISNTRIEIENNQYQLELTKMQLYKDIQQAYDKAQAAMKQYQGSRKALEAMKESFKYTQQKFDVGLVTSLDFNTAKNQLTKAESELLQAKYEYIFRKELLDFYRGRPITLK